jgi:predicted HicB family RNase H-like nuclease
MKQLNYRGYLGTAEVSLEDKCLHGRVQFINDIITYEGHTVEKLQKEFQVAVDRYLTYCANTGQDPDKPFGGSFNIRTGSELHRKLAMTAMKAGVSLNEFVVTALSDALQTDAAQEEGHRGRWARAHEASTAHVLNEPARTYGRENSKSVPSPKTMIRKKNHA